MLEIMEFVEKETLFYCAEGVNQNMHKIKEIFKI